MGVLSKALVFGTTVGVVVASPAGSRLILFPLLTPMVLTGATGGGTVGTVSPIGIRLILFPLLTAMVLIGALSVEVPWNAAGVPSSSSNSRLTWSVSIFLLLTS